MIQKQRIVQLLLHFLRNVDVGVLVSVSIGAIIIVGLDSLGLLDHVASAAHIDFAALAVVILGLVGLHLAVAHVSDTAFHEHFPKHVESIIASLNGVRIEVFASAVEMEEYLAKRIAEAKREVCDLSWKETLSHVFSSKPRAASHRSYERSISKACDRITYREVFIFSDSRRKDKLRRRLKENKAGYSCRYYPGSTSLPRFQYALIDGEEVVFASSAYPTLCAVRHPALAQICQAYFEDVWNNATKLKEGNVIFAEAVKSILDDSRES